MGLVEDWLGALAVTARQGSLSYARGFEGWLRSQGHFRSLEGAVVFQKKAEGDERYRVVRLAVRHVSERGGTYAGMRRRYASLRSFFLHSLAELPKIPVNFAPTRDSSVGRLDLEIFKTIIRSSPLMDQCVYLSCFQAIMDQHKFFTVLNRLGHEIGEHIKERGVEEPFRVDLLRGRKNNPKPYNTWLNCDALQAWQLYFERERGFPKQGEAGVLDREGKPLGKSAFQAAHRRRLRKLNYINGFGEKHTRYGLGPHELRDLAISILQKAKGEGFNELSAEFWSGHLQSVDPLFYKKIWKLDPEYNLAQHKIAAKYLNIISSTPSTQEMEGYEQKLVAVTEKLAKMEEILKKLGELPTEGSASASELPVLT